MQILIDADGCPVVRQTVEAARKWNVPCKILCDTAHQFSDSYAETVVVEKGADSVDFRITNMVEAGDLVITQDYGLSAMCLARKAIPVTQNGLVISDANIDQLLFSRYLSKKMRNAGVRMKGPAKRTEEQNRAFVRVLNEQLQKAMQERKD